MKTKTCRCGATIGRKPGARGPLPALCDPCRSMVETAKRLLREDPEALSCKGCGDDVVPGDSRWCFSCRAEGKTPIYRKRSWLPAGPKMCTIPSCTRTFIPSTAQRFCGPCGDANMAAREAAYRERNEAVAPHRRPLYRLQKGRCGACGEHRKLDELHAHHVVPRVDGGPDTRENLTLVCGSHEKDADTCHREIHRLLKMGFTPLFPFAEHVSAPTRETP